MKQIPIYFLIILLFACLARIQAQSPNLIPFVSKGKWGLQDSIGKKLVEAICDSAFMDPNGDVVLFKNKSISLWTKGGQQLFNFGKYSSGANFNRLIDNQLLPTHKAWAKRTDGRWVILDRSGAEYIPQDNFIETYAFNDGFSVVRKDSGMGLVNYLGEEVIPPIYDSIGISFSEGRLAVLSGKYWALFDSTGIQRSPFEYLHIGQSHAHRIPFKDKTNKWGYLDSAGQVRIAAQYSYASDFSEGLAFCMRGDTIGYIDTSGQVLIPFLHFKYGGRYQEQRAYAGNDKRYGIIDNMGNIIIWSSKYVTIESYSQGYAPVRYSENRLMGYLDWMGKPVILGKFYRSYGFKEYLGRVELNGKFGFVDRMGEFVINPVYDFAFDFSNGLSRVKKGDKIFYIDQKGKEYIYD